jgi:hypothetical protein
MSKVLTWQSQQNHQKTEDAFLAGTTGHSVLLLNDFGILVAGGHSSNSYLQELYLFELDKQEWTLLETENPNAVFPRSHFSMFFEGKNL